MVELKPSGLDSIEIADLIEDGLLDLCNETNVDKQRKFRSVIVSLVRELCSRAMKGE